MHAFVALLSREEYAQGQRKVVEVDRGALEANCVEPPPEETTPHTSNGPDEDATSQGEEMVESRTDGGCNIAGPTSSSGAPLSLLTALLALFFARRRSELLEGHVHPQEKRLQGRDG